MRGWDERSQQIVRKRRLSESSSPYPVVEIALCSHILRHRFYHSQRHPTPIPLNKNMFANKKIFANNKTFRFSFPSSNRDFVDTGNSGFHKPVSSSQSTGSDAAVLSTCNLSKTFLTQSCISISYI